MYECNGDIDKIIEHNNLPKNLKHSMRTNTKCFQTNNGKGQANKNGYFQYIGWYARELD